MLSVIGIFRKMSLNNRAPIVGIRTALGNKCFIGRAHARIAR